ncbi:N-terminal EF-hand calcium-binding protein 1-like [Gouania willdenowi]|uniref:N-terminal EF-hand calcium-binding protein 1-like n=1 Tax=Gouania willdenowi TaxID=441366 RepID=A0A8C5I1J6_GOUWI|nr:N-terminal EF-hand calcium-binding protein 1-like [Gouania willdenowi]
MLSCTKMITMCLQSSKQKHLQLQHQQKEQQNIFHDIFRRADKNDDGKLSFEEFNAYFADGVLTTEELKELFHSIDEQQNKNLDTEKLSDYFSQHLGEYLNVFSALESLNVAISKAVDKTKEEYEDSSVLGQFVTRFMLRETSNQLLSLQTSLHCAMEALDEQACDPARTETKGCELSAAQRNNSRVRHNLAVSLSDSSSGVVTSGFNIGDKRDYSQINRLQQLLDKLEFHGPKLEPCKDDQLSTCTPNILLVQRQMTVTDENLGNFQKVLKRYIDATSANPDNLHMSVQSLPFKSCFMVYEFWKDRVSWMSYLQSNSSKDFQHCIINMLEEAELVSTMLLPASWWINTYN